MYVAFYNLCRTHETLRTTPAVALGIADWRSTGCGCVYRKPRPLDLMRESLNVGRDGRVDLPALEPGGLALQVQVPT